MENTAELGRLEQYIDMLVAKYNDLKARYHDLKATLEERDAQCLALKDEIANLKRERSEVGGRVARLIERIEQWDEEQAASGQIGEGNSEEGEQPGVQGNLFVPEREPMG